MDDDRRWFIVNQDTGAITPHTLTGEFKEMISNGEVIIIGKEDDDMRAATRGFGLTMPVVLAAASIAGKLAEEPVKSEEGYGRMTKWRAKCPQRTQFGPDGGSTKLARRLRRKHQLGRAGAF